MFQIIFFYYYLKRRKAKLQFELKIKQNLMQSRCKCILVQELGSNSIFIYFFFFSNFSDKN